MITLAIPRASVPRGRGIVARVRRALRVARTRRHLATLDAHLLANIGLTPDEAGAEAARPVWDVPASWLR